MQETYGWWLPLNASVQGQSVDQLINLLHVLIAVLFIGWGVFLVTCLVRFRARPGHRASAESRRFRLPFWIELGVALFELGLLVFLSSPIWYQWKNVLPEKKDSLVVRVVAEQFAWNIHYPGRDGIFGKTRLELVDGTNPLGIDREDAAAKDDILTTNVLHIPVDKPVLVYLSSKDVIHGFSLPVLRVKHDAVPGMVIPIGFQATSAGLNLAGKLQIACTQLCGLGHSNMAGQLFIDTAAEFESWMREQENELRGNAE